MSDIRGLILIAIVSALMFKCGAIHADEIPVKCNSNKSEIRKIEKEFTQTIFHIWRKSGNLSDPQKLWREAEFTAYWILRDNNIVCR